MSKLFLWVYLCINGVCDCERIEYGTSTKELYIKTEMVEYNLEYVSRTLNGNVIVMKQDTSYYYVVGGITDKGFIVFVNHIKGDRTKRPVKIDHTLIISNKLLCFR